MILSTCNKAYLTSKISMKKFTSSRTIVHSSKCFSLRLSLPIILVMIALTSVIWTKLLGPKFNFAYQNVNGFEVTSVRNYELDGKAKITGKTSDGTQLTIMIDDLGEAYDMERASKFQGAKFNMQVEVWPDGRLRELHSYKVLN
jgi:hypothetical protein